MSPEHRCVVCRSLPPLPQDEREAREDVETKTVCCHNTKMEEHR